MLHTKTKPSLIHPFASASSTASSTSFLSPPLLIPNLSLSPLSIPLSSMDEFSPPSSSSPPQSPSPHHHHHRQHRHLPSPFMDPPPSSPPPLPHDPSSPPHPTHPPDPPPKPTSSTRRIPPPCWSHEETAALIDSYREKWYSLRRGNLRAAHWQEVADAVAARCPHSSPPKTAVQCRHKMEKLRKRYRAELQRAVSIPNHRFNSSWVHFRRMDFMEKGPSGASSLSSPPRHGGSAGSDGEGVRVTAVGFDRDDGGDDRDGFGGDVGNWNWNGNESGGGGYGFIGYDSNGGGGYSNRELHGFVGGSESTVGGNGFQIRGQGQGGFGSSSRLGNRSKNHGQFEETETLTPSLEGLRYATRIVKNNVSGSGSAPGLKNGLGKRERGSGSGVVQELVEAVKGLGDGILKMERMKIDMVKEVEQMRMEMEVKRTEMILESQQRLVEAFVKGVVEKKKSKKRKLKDMPPPESSDAK